MSRKNIITIGGGTGSFTLLSGLKKYDINLSAIVSMADDGGSTGVLRDELGVLPPGDVRQCLAALSDSEKSLRELLSYRFEEGKLKGHNFGNLFLSALEKINGSFSRGIEEAKDILKVKGDIIPVTENEANLCIRLKNNKILEGESKINHSNLQRIGITKICYKPKITANPRAIEAIKKADLIVIGPGNHYCSILPNLIIKDFSQAIRESKAKVIYNCNLTNKKGHTENFDVDDFVESINKYIGRDRVNYVLFNSKNPNQNLIARYEKQEGVRALVHFNQAKNPARKFKLIKGDFLSRNQPNYSKADKLASKRAFIRHDSDKLAKAIRLVGELDSYKSFIKGII